MKKIFSVLKEIKPFSIVMLTVAGIINASGTSMLLSLSVFLVVLNVPLFLCGLKNREKVSHSVRYIRRLYKYSLTAL